MVAVAVTVTVTVTMTVTRKACKMTIGVKAFTLEGKKRVKSTILPAILLILHQAFNLAVPPSSSADLT